MSYNWKPGMKAVCIEARPTPHQSLRVGQIYMVQRVTACAHGRVQLDFGMPGNVPGWSGYTEITGCGCLIKGKVHRAERFRPLDELEATMDRLEKEGCPTSLPEPELA